MSTPHTLPSPPPLDQLTDGRPVALFLDFDGTLVEIAATPDAIHVPDGLLDQIEGLGSRLEGRLALVSGRSLDDIEGHLGTPRVARAGSHGISRMHADGSRLGEVPEGLPDAAMASLERFADENGLPLERKEHGAAIHYRSSPEQGQAAIAFGEGLAMEHGLAVTCGKCVVELVRPGANKGGAVRAFMKVSPFAGAVPVFVGDDVTDEDGFAAALELGGHAILVGDRADTVANFRLETVDDVHEWLAL